MEDLLNVIDYNEERLRGIEHCEHDNSVASQITQLSASTKISYDAHRSSFGLIRLDPHSVSYSIPEYSMIPECLI
jgi:hypothetical protein